MENYSSKLENGAGNFSDSIVGSKETKVKETEVNNAENSLTVAEMVELDALSIQLDQLMSGDCYFPDKLLDQLIFLVKDIQSRMKLRAIMFLNIFKYMEHMWPKNSYKYSSFENFLCNYPEFEELDSVELSLLLQFSLWMDRLFWFITPKKNKGLALKLITSLVEGNNKSYITGNEDAIVLKYVCMFICLLLKKTTGRSEERFFKI